MHTNFGLPVMMLAIYSRQPDTLLLIKDLKKSENAWKFIGEGMHEGESEIDAVIRALWEEGGFWLANRGDPEVCIEEVRKPYTVYGANPHLQYFYKTRLPYCRLRDLSGKKFPGKDEDEFFETQEFPIDLVDAMPDFFGLHRKLYREFLGYTA